MSTAAQEQLFQYPFVSSLQKQDAQQTLRLATFTVGKQPRPFFFQGQLARPRRVADQLRSVMTIVKSRFHIPAAMLTRILAESDPVVTGNDDLLRFEGFSACCGAYVRVDLLPDAFTGEATGRGTTNVDFNQPMLAALAKVRATDKVSLAVGADKVVLKTLGAEVVEKKVRLPQRWMKGFVEVQSVQSRMQHACQIQGPQAFRFFRGLPRMKTHRRETFVTQSGQGLRLTQLASSGGVRVGGLERLRVLESLSRDANTLDIYSDQTTGASGWVLSYDDCRFQLVISPEVWRGFSGEGQALDTLAKSDKDHLSKVHANLKWQSVDVEQIARSTKLKADSVQSALAMLGTRGLVGFDLKANAWFHRELPFDVSQVEKQQPRLKAARKLLAEKKVRLFKQSKTRAEFRINSSDVEHRVKIESVAKSESTISKCTCPWFNKHEHSRGPCKHILAAQILLEESLEKQS